MRIGSADHDEIYRVLEQVLDPEVPVVSVVDLGIIHQIQTEGESIVVTILPTYSGCPALDEIEIGIKSALEDSGYRHTKVKRVLDPAWTTDMITESGKEKLKAYGIAPPTNKALNEAALFSGEKVIECPRCHSKSTSLVSAFGSTACKALFQCDECKEPFDYFKCH